MGTSLQTPGAGKGRSNDKPSRKQRETELDSALAQTFPASDPVAVGGITSTEPPARPPDRQAPEPPQPRRRRRKPPA